MPPALAYLAPTASPFKSNVAYRRRNAKKHRIPPRASKVKTQIGRRLPVALCPLALAIATLHRWAEADLIPHGLASEETPQTTDLNMRTRQALLGFLPEGRFLLTPTKARLLLRKRRPRQRKMRSIAAPT